MVTLEQIKLLESKIIRAIDIVNRLSEENVRIKKRNEELEELAERLKDEKSRVEAGIVSALDRLNQFEDAIERSLAAPKPVASPPPSPHAVPGPAVPPAQNAPPQPAAVVRSPEVPAQNTAARPAETPHTDGFPSAYTVDEAEEPEELESAEQGEAELDIF
jgi:uncharacterized phage infection (PIP) family protein YhgE